jgi:hypothetical protein
MSTMPPSPFLTFEASFPAALEPAVAAALAPREAAAGTNSNSCADVMLAQESAAIIEAVTTVVAAAPITRVTHNAVTHAVEVRPQIQSSDGAGESRPRPEIDVGPGASRSSSGSVNAEAWVAPSLSEATDCIGEIFVGARRLQPRELPPDFHARLLEAIESDGGYCCAGGYLFDGECRECGATSNVDCPHLNDEIWADEAPLFLRRDV